VALAVALDRTPIERTAGRLMIANGVLGLAGAFVTAFKLDWVMTTAGMVSYGLWNVLVFALAALLVATFRARMASPSHSRTDHFSANVTDHHARHEIGANR
jgi:hypothetical protein